MRHLCLVLLLLGCRPDTARLETAPRTVVGAPLGLQCPAHADECHAPLGTSYHSGVNVDLGDFGLLAREASCAACAGRVAQGLRDKLEATLADPQGFTGWLEGVNVSLACATAMELAGSGVLTPGLDELITRSRDRYAQHFMSASCGFDPGEDGTPRWTQGDTCMDDHAIAASAWAWLGAYEQSRGRPSATLVAAARLELAASLSPNDAVCIVDPTQLSTGVRGPCTGSAASLAHGATTLSLNHGTQNISYGAGLFTSLSSAELALRLAGAPVRWSADEQAVIAALFREAQEKTDCDGGAFLQTCAFISGTTLATGADCGDPRYHYRPTMFPLHRFAERALGSVPPSSCGAGSAWDFASFDPTLFVDGSPFFHAGRQMVYGALGDAWWVAAPTLSGPLADPAPIGWIDEVTASGLVRGWTCDRVAPEVDLVVSVEAMDGTVLAEGATDGANEEVVSSLCGGGARHRFALQLRSVPWDFRVVAHGREVRASLSGTACPAGECHVGGVVRSSLTDGEVLTGAFSWTVDAPGAIRVQLVVNGHDWNSPLTSAPFSLPIDGSKGTIDGTYRISARAFDAWGNAHETSTVTVTLSNPHVVCGAAGFDDEAGVHWMSDEGLSSGLAWDSADLTLPRLYRAERFFPGGGGYVFHVQPGRRDVTLHFAEIVYQHANQRVFDIVLNDTPVFTALDLAASGVRVPVDLTFAVDAPDGEVRVFLRPRVENPKISALEIR